MTPVKIPAVFFAEIDIDPKIRMEIQGTRIAKIHLKKWNAIGGLIPSNFKT